MVWDQCLFYHHDSNKVLCDIMHQDVVYKDIIEPLESVSVNLVPTDKDDITLFGSPEEARAGSRLLTS